MIAIASDHGGFGLKQEVIKFLEKKGIEVKDFGTHSEESTDYPIYAKAAAETVVSGQCEKAILICGTGIGMSIAANKVKGVRAALCNDLFCARLSREHNDANVLCMGARVIGLDLAFAIVDEWLGTAFSNAGRHAGRIKMIGDMEK
jgi:ribose 5-phosphate isomerase B